MAQLVPARSNRDVIKLLAERIGASQVDEISRMNRWLQARGDSTAAAHEHAGHTGAHVGMPGMLSPEELARLGAASGSDFDRLFLESMIRHHEGALTMVAQLFSKPGSVQDPDLYQLASSIDADQRAEIARMRALLSNIQ